MLVQYVIARESFDIAILQANYQKVGLWSAEQARSDYLGLMQVSNLEGPLSLYPRSSVVETRVKSVSRLDPQSALVRFDTIRRDQGGQQQPAQPWVSGDLGAPQQMLKSLGGKPAAPVAAEPRANQQQVSHVALPIASMLPIGYPDSPGEADEAGAPKA
jgi:hypothetical protein